MFEEETFETTFRLFVLSSAVQETEEQHVVFFFLNSHTEAPSLPCGLAQASGASPGETGSV